jgi:hypothetical protein
VFRVDSLVSSNYYFTFISSKDMKGQATSMKVLEVDVINKALKENCRVSTVL